MTLLGHSHQATTEGFASLGVGLCREAVLNSKHAEEDVVLVKTYWTLVLTKEQSVVLERDEGFAVSLSLNREAFTTAMGLRHWDPRCGCAHINNANLIWTSSALHTWFLIIPDTLNFFRECFPGEKGKEKERWRYISNISFMNKHLGVPCFSLTQNPPGYACCPCTMAVPIFSIRVQFLSSVKSVTPEVPIHSPYFRLQTCKETQCVLGFSTC